MKVAVGSKNPIKIKAVENVLKSLNFEFSLFSQKVSGIPQPKSLKESLEGAMMRAKSCKNFDFAFGIEAGIHRIEDFVFNTQFCAVFDGKNFTIGHSSGFQIPDFVFQRIKKGEELAEIFSDFTDIKNIKRGLIGFLTENRITRLKLTEECVLMAMVPRLKKDLYF